MCHMLHTSKLKNSLKVDGNSSSELMAQFGMFSTMVKHILRTHSRVLNSKAVGRLTQYYFLLVTFQQFWQKFMQKKYI